MGSFVAFLHLLSGIADPRKAKGKRYELRYILLFSILAILTGANSYRSISTFFKVHRKQLNGVFGLKWWGRPSHTSIRNIFLGLDTANVETIFRAHAAGLDADVATGACAGRRVLAVDGKVLKGSFDRFSDQKARQILNAFASDTDLILAHIDIEDKSNEIPAAQQLLTELKIPHRTVTMDALHCQKKPSKLRKTEIFPSSSN
jgi:hypothetical protein